MAAHDDDVWTFGYGSLVWRPAMQYEERVDGYIEGWARRFWQGSYDHRGVPGAPGRVVTLVRSPGERVYGAAYRLCRTVADEVLAALDHREKGGYERYAERFTGLDKREIDDVLVYVAPEGNKHWLGPAPVEEIAAQVSTAVGPSGANVEYVVELAKAMRAMGVDDAHLFAVEAALG